jgi:exodeoxyribonuclease VII large subunit
MQFLSADFHSTRFTVAAGDYAGVMVEEIQVRTVADVAKMVADYIDRLGTIWIEGQLAEWNPRAKAVYAKLKDLSTDATLSITVWNNVLATMPDTFAQGDKVRVLAKANFWPGGGTLSFQVVDIRHEGLGDILEKIERLRSTLRAEGALDPERKKPLPFLPLCIGLITGERSDAEQDVLTNAKLRWSDVKFRVVHTLVQGEQCPPQVAEAIRTLDADPEVDVIIIARGGGEFLQLAAFSDERIMRAAIACETPIVSAIGHEPDRPLLDEVADLRASTPTDAAKRVVPDVTAEIDGIAAMRSRGLSLVSTALGQQAQFIAQLRSRPVMASPAGYLDRLDSDLRNYVNKGATLIEHRIERAADVLHRLRASLRALSPQNTLDRGYSILRGADGRVVTTVSTVTSGDALSIRVGDGDIAATAN